MRSVKALVSSLDQEVEQDFMEIDPSDIEYTYANMSDLQKDINFKLSRVIEEGLKKFVTCYREYYRK